MEWHVKLVRMKTLFERDLTPTEMLKAFDARDASYDGLFVFAVRTTGIFCRPSCASRPKLEHVEFFGSIREAATNGYRPCKRCRPLEANGTPPPWIASVMREIENHPETKMSSESLRAEGVTPERVRRWFLQNYGMTFVEWCRGMRLSSAFTQIRSGDSIDDAVFANGYDSHSGFRDAYTRTFGNPPGKSRHDGERITTAMLESPLGPMLAATTDRGICFLEFADRRMLETNCAAIRKIFDCPIVPGKHKWLDQLGDELEAYFKGSLKSFSVPFENRGTSFQEKVWAELCKIPFGKTISYEALATRIGKPSAKRAVARANGTNRICILIPCHRVIAKDGTLSGYGGGVWRKRHLLKLERETTLYI